MVVTSVSIVVVVNAGMSSGGEVSRNIREEEVVVVVLVGVSSRGEVSRDFREEEVVVVVLVGMSSGGEVSRNFREEEGCRDFAVLQLLDDRGLLLNFLIILFRLEDESILL